MTVQVAVSQVFKHKLLLMFTVTAAIVLAFGAILAGPAQAVDVVFTSGGGRGRV